MSFRTLSKQVLHFFILFPHYANLLLVRCFQILLCFAQSSTCSQVLAKSLHLPASDQFGLLFPSTLAAATLNLFLALFALTQASIA